MNKIIFLMCFMVLSVQAAEGNSGNKNALKRQESSQNRGALVEVETLPKKYADFKKWLNDLNRHFLNWIVFCLFVYYI